jgi:hypothetical protein
MSNRISDYSVRKVSEFLTGENSCTALNCISTRTNKPIRTLRGEAVINGILKALRRTMVCSFALMVVSVPTQAIPIVDTGSSPFVGIPDPGILLENANGRSQFVAGRFTTTEAFQITGLSAFVRNFACCDVLTSQFHLSIASGPSFTNNSSFTNLVAAQTSYTAASGAAGWADASIGNYLLDPGTYWIVASVLPGDLSIGLGMPGGVPNPMDTYAYFSSALGGWNPANFMLSQSMPATFGFRVTGNAIAVPEPSALLLLGGGLFTLLVLRVQRRSHHQSANRSPTI